MKVLKFGGSSVGTPERIDGIVQILRDYDARGERFCVVFSAFGGVTDALIEMARKAEGGEIAWEEDLAAFRERHLAAADHLTTGERRERLRSELTRLHDTLASLLQGVFLVREASARTMDYVLSFGERSSAFVISRALQEHGLNAQFLDAREIIKTDKRFGAANVRFDQTYENIEGYFRTHGGIQVVTGFIASTLKGLTTTLGRGGSDYTASLLAAGLNAKRIEIWTDVDGVMTADPRAVKRAFTIPQLTYAEAMEMWHFGAKVIYPPTLQPAMRRGVPLYIKNTFRPDFAGTLVSEDVDPRGRAVKGISSVSGVSLLTLEGTGLFGVVGVSGRLFGTLARAGINVILITQGSSEHNITFAVSPDRAERARRQVEQEFAYEIEAGLVRPVKVEPRLSVVAVIGQQMRFRPGIAGRLFRALGRNGINCVAIAQGSSELNISVVIARDDEAKALNALHDAFFLSDERDVNVFLVGTGLIADELMRQMSEERDRLRETKNLNLRLVGLTNTRRMHFDEAEGIDLADWREALTQNGEPANLGTFVDRVVRANLANSIFVDCSASETVAAHYERLLGESISVSTPNKVATSGSYERYRRLKDTAAQNSASFVYETNVGAGLPVLSTLHDLSASGDVVQRIEGVLSGSLGFIFDAFDGSRPFSAVVAEAGERGYTEPDPRVDLSGKDVARKVVILAREAGVPLELADVTVEPFLSEAAFAAESVESFFEALRGGDDEALAERVTEAGARGRKLKVIGRYANGQASVGLREVDASSPFYTLGGSDNMIVFATERYDERPLVIRGPGAGAAVTAAGVFAEIITVGSLRTWE